jgi:hypothetical protein
MADNDRRRHDSSSRYDDGYDESLDEIWPPRPQISPGKRTLTQGLVPVAGLADDMSIARQGVAGARSTLPYAEEMSRAYGTDFGDVAAHVGPEAVEACDALDAQAYTLGGAIAFADSRPSRAVVAHELAHVVQQRGGTPSIARLTNTEARPSSGDLEEEAHRASEQAVAGMPVTTALTPSARRVSRLRRFGTVVFRPEGTEEYDGYGPPVSRPAEQERGSLPLNARTVDEWNACFRGRLPPYIERHAFMLAALELNAPDDLFVSPQVVERPQERDGYPPDPYDRGRYTQTRYRLVNIEGSPTENEKIALARSMMHSGGERGDTSGPHEERSGIFLTSDAGGGLVREFLSRYAGAAIEARSRGMQQMGPADVRGVEEFAGRNRENRDEDRNDAVVGAALGQSFSGATRYLHTDEAAGNATRSRYEHLNLLHNSALTLRGIVAGRERSAAAEREQSRQRMQTSFAVAMGVVAGLTPTGPVAALVNVLTSLGSTFFEQLVGQGHQESTRALKSGFRRDLTQYGMSHGIDARDVEICVMRFELALHY